MELGFLGLGRMGANMVQRLLNSHHSVVVWNRTYEKSESLALEGAVPARTPGELVRALRRPKILWLMLPAGPITEQMLQTLRPELEPGDIIIDGGNTHYKEDIRRFEELKKDGIHYIDVGTSGGIWGLERGYCLMIGGDTKVSKTLEPIFRSLAPGQGSIPPAGALTESSSTAHEGFLHCGSSGSGHFVKMIHNGIEYGMMQAYAEGFNLLQKATGSHAGYTQSLDFDMASIAELWRRGSVIGSWLLDLTAQTLSGSPDLDNFEGLVHDSGEGRWTVEAAVDLATPIPVLAGSLFARFDSRAQNLFANKLLAALRHQFGGHRE